MEFALLGSILALRVVQNITGKACSKLMPTDGYGLSNYMSLRMGLSAVAAFVFLIISLKGNIIESIATLSPLGWVLSLLTGLAITVSSICSLLCMHTASVALVVLFGSAGLLVPTISGIFIFGQKIAVGQWLGIACLIAAAVLLASSSNKTNSKINAKTILLLFGSMLSNGATMLLQTLFKAYVPSGNVSLYSFLQFAIPGIGLLAVGLFGKRKEKREGQKISKKLFVISFIAAAALFGISQISTVASAVIPVAVLFSISDGGNTVISAVVAALFFKEKFTVRSLIGVTVGVGGLIMMKLSG